MTKHKLSSWIRIAFVLTAIINISVPAFAQGGGPVVTLLGRIDGKSSPPNAQAAISVVDPVTGRAMDGLTMENFVVQISEEVVPVIDAQASASGVALAVVVDRGGIGRGTRREQVVDLLDALMNKVLLDGSPNSDMVGLIGIRGREEESEGKKRDLVPLVPFTDFDANLIRNEFDALKTESVTETTPLYDGLDEAVEWLSENGDSAIQSKLDLRRKIILVFSDGIDNKFSSETHETNLIKDCLENNISIFTVRMAAGTVDEDNMEVLAYQTNGMYVSYAPGEEDAVYEAFDNMISQRNIYKVTFPVIRAKNDYIVTIKVQDTASGDAEVEGRVASVLTSPSITLVPPADLSYTVTYTETDTAAGFLPVQITMGANVAYADGVNRPIDKVTYFANGLEIGTSQAAPDYLFTWDVTNMYTPTTEIREQDFSLSVKVKDPYLDSMAESDTSTIHVMWEAKPGPIFDPTSPGVNWVMLIVVGLLVLGMIVLMILLLRTRAELAKKVINRTTGFIKGMTQRLSGGSNASVPAYGTLVITRGRNPSTEFKIAAPLIKVGRDPQFCDFALYDSYVSNPHFSIMMEQNQFYITDEGSANKTRLNGMFIEPHQRVQLPPDSVIEVGQVQMQFKRAGSVTRPLGENNTTFQQNSSGPMPGANAQQQAYGYGGQQSQDANPYGQAPAVDPSITKPPSN